MVVRVMEMDKGRAMQTLLPTMEDTRAFGLIPMDVMDKKGWGLILRRERGQGGSWKIGKGISLKRVY